MDPSAQASADGRRQRPVAHGGPEQPSRSTIWPRSVLAKLTGAS